MDSFKGRRYLQNGSNTYPHVGKMVNEQLLAKKLSKAEIAKKLFLAENGILKYCRHKSLQVGILWNLSEAIGHNFFEELASLLPPNGKPVATSEMNEAILERDKKIEVLENELKLYKQLILDGMKGKVI